MYQRGTIWKDLNKILHWGLAWKKKSVLKIWTLKNEGKNMEIFFMKA
jgi:hypothetical protein